MPQSFHILSVHIVFSTKQRRPLLHKAARMRVWPYLSGILHNMGCMDITVGGEADHVHILCNLSKHHASTNIMEELKRDSSKWIKQEFSDLADFYWQNGYGLFSISPSHRDAVQNYILGQEEHHRKEDFKSELLRLLSKYKAQYDETYLWD
jgi:REP element-mobilizing transposase RayT